MAIFKQLEPLEPATDKSHHVGNPPASFQNPWPSHPESHISIPSVLKARYWDEKPPFVPVPSDRSELVQVRKPDFSVPQSFDGFRVTWIGHASFLIQCCSSAYSRSINILLDPVFAERTSPFTFLGPKRYTPTPCTLLELLDAVPIDVVCISHNHYDHADVGTLKSIYEHRKAHQSNVLFCVALGNPRWLHPLGIPKELVWEADWWDRIELSTPQFFSLEASSLPSTTDPSSNGTKPVKASSSNTVVRITCTPSQHDSRRSPFDGHQDLWCSWTLELVSASSISAPVSNTPDKEADQSPSHRHKSLFFAGDTGYRTIPTSNFPDSEIASLPTCPAFKLIGKYIGPFDLALLPIGLCRPRYFTSRVHCNSADSMDVHQDIKAQRSVGMHWGTVRGGISGQYEDVRDPPREWQEEAKKRGLKWRGGQTGDEDNTEWQAGLMDVGESMCI